jgi:hypothetical protein
MLRKGAVLAALTALALGAATAGADEAVDRKVYPGTMCVPSWHQVQGISYSPPLGVSNYSGSTQSFICPVLNDAIQAGWANAQVQVRGVGVRCFGVASPWGTLSAFVTPAATSNSQSLRSLYLSSSFFEDTDLGMTNNPLTSVWADFNIVCQVPSGGSIVRYYVREK